MTQVKKPWCFLHRPGNRDQEKQPYSKTHIFCTAHNRKFMRTVGNDGFNLFWEMKEAKLIFQNISLWYFELSLPVSSVFAQLYTPDGTCHGLHNFVVPIRNGTALLQITLKKDWSVICLTLSYSSKINNGLLYPQRVSSPLKKAPWYVLRGQCCISSEVWKPPVDSYGIWLDHSAE